MDLFVNKIRNTVSQVAYQVNTSVNTIIPGNVVHRDYETLKFRCNHGPPGLVWSVYDAVKRDSASIKASLRDAIGPNLIPPTISSTNSASESAGDNLSEKKLFSVFVFDKNQLDALGKSDRETVIEHIKRGVTQLTRLRHPAILTVHHGLEESRSCLAFVTEHVYGHLESILIEQRVKRINDGTKKVETDLVTLNEELGPKDTDYVRGSCQLDELQIKAGLLQVCDGLKFIHNDAKMLHRNICLDNIFVDSNNTWKIAGFEFSCTRSSDGTASDNQTSNNLDITEFVPRSIESPAFPSLKITCNKNPSIVIPNWSCSAPEHSNCDQVHSSADVYSLGVLSCALLGKDRDLIDISYEYGLISDTYKRGIRLRELADGLPQQIKTPLMKFAAINAESRPSLEDYQHLSLFEDEHVKAIRDLDSQFAWDRLKKIDFFNRLRVILPNLSHQVKVNRVARSLVNELLNPDMLPHVLPNILIIAKDSTPTEFRTRIFPHLEAPFRILEPRVVPILLLDNLHILADRSKFCLNEFQLSAFTLIQHLLRMDQQLQEKCLNTLPVVKRYIDEVSMNTKIIPELNRLSKETTVMATRIKILDCIAGMIDTMQQRSVVNHVLPLLIELPCRDSGVIMAAARLVKDITNCPKLDLPNEIIASKILPFLIPLCVEKDLDLQGFNTLMQLIRNTMDIVEREQRGVLSKKSRISSQKSSALVLNPQGSNTFKGSKHFELE